MSLERAGSLTCACAPIGELQEFPGHERFQIVASSCGFALAFLAQTLVVAALPEASAQVAPTPVWAGLPYIAWLAGVLIASFPASLLSGAFGARAAHALGACLGLAGGALAAYSFFAMQFPGLILGAFWLGLAQGFGQFYRHVAASGSKGLLLLFSLACLSVLLAPAVSIVISAQWPLLEDGMLLAVSGIFSFFAVAIGVIWMPTRRWLASNSSEGEVKAFPWVLALTAGVSWMVMTALMSGAPIRLKLCGADLSETSGMMSLHMLAMVLPAACLAAFTARLSLPLLLGLGLALQLLAISLHFWHPSLVGTMSMLLMAGCGWSLVNLSTIALLHRASPARWQIAFNDFIVFFLAALGASIGPVMSIL